MGLEQILGSIASLEPVTVLTYAAACTERIRLGSAVLLTALRSPVYLAKAVATLDHLSGGRTTSASASAATRGSTRRSGFPRSGAPPGSPRACG
jgi:alkanesulfonate monooxygenase SsuD/methylene tetrahydromethanopterin reductase-like flavin-dependent oxidoreductase (luciferase family)